MSGAGTAAAAAAAADATADARTAGPYSRPCTQHDCSGVSRASQNMLRRRDAARVGQIEAAEAATAKAEAATAKAEAATAAAETRAAAAEAALDKLRETLSATESVAIEALGELQQRRDAARWRAERSSARAMAEIAAAAAMATPRTPSPSGH